MTNSFILKDRELTPKEKAIVGRTRELELSNYLRNNPKKYMDAHDKKIRLLRAMDSNRLDNSEKYLIYHLIIGSTSNEGFLKFDRPELDKKYQAQITSKLTQNNEIIKFSPSPNITFASVMEDLHREYS
ncbi:hypothetical protein COU54_02310 [Candidatus Pacearchaeota archaeon CG10_big_fil_rev_8_21_14_0_10_31_24]|nr:MAG: hypothetical protein COU54_02310 [Candidatus Pacearchaeota archaeon CG10_big_fil_rev_8_21_14_0_10_31_24]